MNMLRKSVSKIVLFSCSLMIIYFNVCEGGVTLVLQDSVRISKSISTTETLDHGKFAGTACTTGWSSKQHSVSTGISARLIWQQESSPFYVQASTRYGWAFNGTQHSYPLNWDLHGNSWGYGLGAGYSKKIGKRFGFSLFGGLSYGVGQSTTTHQRSGHKNPSSFASSNGDKTIDKLYNPYVGFGLDFSKNFFNKYTVSFAVSYDVGFVFGLGKTKVPYLLITNNPATSSYGSRTKYSDVISHDFEIGTAYSISEHWRVSLKLDYSTTYNTHKLPVKLQHNDAIVKAGQYTPTQYHVVSDSASEVYTVIFGVVYDFSAKSTSTAYLQR